VEEILGIAQHYVGDVGGACRPPPPKNLEKYFSVNYHVKFGQFSGKNKYYVKFGNFVNFSGKYVKFVDLYRVSCYFARTKMS